VDAASGNRSLVSDFGNAAQGPLGIDQEGLALEPAARSWSATLPRGRVVLGALFRVDRLGGQRTMLSDFGNSGQGDLGADPYRVAVVVPNCLGRVPTLVGDDGNNVLIGSPRADVIFGRAGDDLIDGQGGDDRICGGDGNDALRVGSGNDLADGGAGADTIEGNTGNDRLDGRAGTDLIIGGEGNDRCSGEVKLGCER
jgi:Ca2+-binding RTX toxin-like protein